jgi:hypothetical protein
MPADVKTAQKIIRANGWNFQQTSKWWIEAPLHAFAEETFNL